MQEVIDKIINELEDKKAQDILYVNTQSKMHPITDAIIVSSALNEVHLKALMNNLISFYKNNRSSIAELEYFGASGKPDSQWVILDFNSLVIHLMSRDIREQYDFDSLFDEFENYRYH